MAQARDDFARQSPPQADKVDEATEWLRRHGG
jgi:hypothetical protein